MSLAITIGLSLSLWLGLSLGLCLATSLCLLLPPSSDGSTSKNTTNHFFSAITENCTTGSVSLKLWTKVKPSNSCHHTMTILINDRQCGDFKGFKVWKNYQSTGLLFLLKTNVAIHRAATQLAPRVKYID